MKINCSNCGKQFNRKPSIVREVNYCSNECRKKQITKPCETCGKLVTRCQSQMLERVFCSRECAKEPQAIRMTEMNSVLNRDRMTIKTRTKLRKARLGKGAGKAYTKTFGIHTHRLVAEKMIGRKLKKGEVVHHIDEDKRNNHPLNLMVFPLQAAHALWHKNEKIDPSRNYE